jgi:hypothetical protein
MAEVVLNEPITQTVSTVITGYTINKLAAIVLDTSLTINVVMYSNGTMIKTTRLTLTGEDFNSWRSTGRSYLDVFVRNNLF